MRSCWRRAAIAALGIGLVACGGGGGKKDEGPPTTTAAPATADAQIAGFRAELVVVELPGTYKVRLSWNPALPSPSQWKLEKRERSGETEPILIPGPRRDFEDTAISPGKEYEYQLFALEFGNEQRKGTKRIGVPRGGRLPHVRTEAVPFDATLLAGTRPQDYSVRLKWDRVLPEPEFYVVRKTSEKSGTSTPLRIPSRSGDENLPMEFFDRDLTADDTYLYELMQESHDGAASLVRSRKLQVPKDLEIRGATPFPAEDIRISGRLFFRAGAELRLADRTGSIVAGEILSEGATITSFRDREVPATTLPIAPGPNGKTGGTLTVRARRMSGHLALWMRGQDGAPGSRGAPGNEGRQGPPGLDSRLGTVNVVPGLTLGREVTTAQTGCTQEPTNGSPGEKGSDGARGTAGGAGGDGGRVLFVLDDDSPTASTQIEVRSGNGGEGGAGGAAGRGGRGGLAGKNLYPVFCVTRDLRDGADGPPGKAGEAGANGARGRDGIYCQRLQGRESGDCAPFKDLLRGTGP